MGNNNHPLLSHDGFPALIEPEGTRDIVHWIKGNPQRLRKLLNQFGAVLFRGFDVDTAAKFSAFMQSSTTGTLPYTERSSPRRSVTSGSNIYTSTEYPPEREIFLHNEHSYSLHFPQIIAFCCLQPSNSGGETPIADTRKIYARISSSTRRELQRRKYLYLRNFDGVFGLPWKIAFQSADRSALEAYCRSNEIEATWKKSGDVLMTRQVREVVAQHPQTGELCWFNHLTFFHSRSIDPDILAMLRDLYPTDNDLPHSTHYGDGSPIGSEIIDELRSAYESEKVSFRWIKGDVLFIDNLLTSHGRAKFEGPRQVIVGMADPLSWDRVRHSNDGTN